MKTPQDLGYRNVVSIAGGFEAWLKANLTAAKANDDIDFS